MTQSRLDRPRPVQVPGPDGYTLALHDFGGDGPTLLFAHAAGLHGWTWSVLAQHLVDQFHCWAIDFRGHGDSAVDAADELHFEEFGSDVLAAVDAIGEQRVIGVGHSLGGAALVLAELARPGSFSELLLYEPGLRPTQAPTAAELAHQQVVAASMRRRRSRFGCTDEALATYARRSPMSPFQASALAAYVDYGFAPCPADDGVELKCPPEVEARIVEMATAHDAVGRISALRCPLTQVYGTASPPPLQEGVIGVAQLSGTRAIPVDGLGHFGPLEQPGTIADVIARNLLPH